MRWPLRIQILAPLAALMLITLAAVSALNAYLSARLCRQQIQQQLSNVIREINESGFPLNDATLDQIAGLSGAEYVLSDQAGRLLSTSRRDLSLTAFVPPEEFNHLTLDEIVSAIEKRRSSQLANKAPDPPQPA